LQGGAACGAGLHAPPALRANLAAANNRSVSMTQPGVEPDRIELDDPQSVAHWTKKLDASEEQLREAVQAVGQRAADVEMHLKGSRSTTNSDRVQELG
jgi:hypothetical protein